MIKTLLSWFGLMTIAEHRQDVKDRQEAWVSAQAEASRIQEQSLREYDRLLAESNALALVLRSVWEAQPELRKQLQLTTPTDASAVIGGRDLLVALLQERNNAAR